MLKKQRLMWSGVAGRYAEQWRRYAEQWRRYAERRHNKGKHGIEKGVPCLRSR